MGYATGDKRLPVIDLHCDLLCYLAGGGGAHPANTGDIGCAIPALVAGSVKLQVLAIYCSSGPGSVAWARRQADVFRRLLDDHRDSLFAVAGARQAREALSSNRIGVVAAIENASGLCEEDEPLEKAFTRLRRLIELIGPLLYVTFTHFGENRFGGGNATEVGLKDDGRLLLDELAGKRIAVDLSHTSDAMAEGILEHIECSGLDLPVIASHSNMRSVWDSQRNLPDWLIAELVRRRGLIGLNFLREYVHPDDPMALARHLEHGLAVGARDALCFGADFFATKDHPDPSRAPYFHDEHGHAGLYQKILMGFEEIVDHQDLERLACRNAMGYLTRSWHP